MSGEPHAALGADTPSVADKRLDSWKEIATYLKREVRTVQLWEKTEELPVHRHIHKGRASVYAYKTELDTWWNNSHPRLEQAEEAKPISWLRGWMLAAAFAGVTAGIALWSMNRKTGLFGRPNASFAFELAALPLQSSAYPVVGDFNGDGIVDIAASVNSGVFPTNRSRLAVFLGKGKGDFAAPNFYEPGDGCWTMRGLATADVNKDGALDLVRLADGSNATCFGNKFSVHLGDGTGKFSEPGNVLTTGGSPTSLATGDFNEDGNLDVAIYGRDESSVFLHFGDGKGSFRAEPKFAAVKGNGGDGELVASDVNGDGHMDLLVALYQKNLVKLFLGTEAGSLVSSPTSFAVSTPVSMVAGDLNGDVSIDLAVLSNLGGILNIYRGNEEGLSSTPISLTVSPAANNLWSGLTRVIGGDFNDDGHVDLAVVGGTSNILYVLQGDRQGNFSSLHRFSLASSFGWRIAAADFDKDGLLDLVVTSYNPPCLLLLRNKSPTRKTAKATGS